MAFINKLNCTEKKEEEMKRKLLCLFVALCMIMSSVTCISMAAEKSVSYETAMEKTAAYMLKTSGNKFKFGQEWQVLGLARSGAKVSQSVYDNYYDDVVKTVKAAKGDFGGRKYTEYSRVILALTAIGKDPRNVGGYNLLKKLADFENVRWQGINGSIFALIALDSKNYEIPKVTGVEKQTTRDLLIKDILDQEIEGGGFALNGGTPDPDITGMAVQALAGYMDRSDVKAAVNRALDVISDMQKADGTFTSWGTKNAESIVQVLVGLTALGIDPAKDDRFIRNGNTVIDALLSFYDEKGGFRHVNEASGGYEPVVNGMATEQGYYALTAYDRLLKGKTGLYDMTDGKQTVTKPAKAVITSLKSTKTKTFTVKWKKVSSAKGYQVRYAKNSKFTGSKYVMVSGSSLSRTVKSLSKGKTYYVKVRAYKTDAKGAKIYGNYSTVKKIKVK